LGHSAIVIPVAELEPVVRAMMPKSIPAYLFTDPAAIHAHVTVLGPFVDRGAMDDELLGELQGFFQRAAPFTYRLSGAPRTLDDGTICLEPEPSGPVRELTEALWRAYPDYPPYGGVHAVPVPHMTLRYPWASDSGTASPSDLAAEVEPLTRQRVEARTAALAWYEPYGSHIVASFDLAG
jgi:hypothetical protein